jgi:alkylhydroperoxidase/carboxymuconolactone decarboxylase family protein YurZ
MRATPSYLVSVLATRRPASSFDLVFGQAQNVTAGPRSKPLPSGSRGATDNGLMQAQAGEAITHLAFHVGWPNVFSARPVVKDVFEKRPR